MKADQLKTIDAVLKDAYEELERQGVNVYATQVLALDSENHYWTVERSWDGRISSSRGDKKS